MIDRFALLIGAAKSGTTALYRWLEQHPEIAACREKEPGVLSDRGRWREGLSTYAALWPGWMPGRHRWALEASTEYSKLPLRPNAVQAAWYLPAEFRFLYLVRDPLARIRSHMLHYLAEGWIDQPLTVELAPETIFFSSYGFQLAPYVAAHGRERVCVLSYERFRRDPLATARRVCEFLEVDPDFAFQNPGSQNSSERYRAKLLARVVNERGVLAQVLDPERCAQVPLPALRRTLAGAFGPDGEATLAECEAELERWITPSPEQVERVHEALDDELARFAAEWGVDPWAADAPRPAAALAG